MLIYWRVSIESSTIYVLYGSEDIDPQRLGSVTPGETRRFVGFNGDFNGILMVI